MPSPKASVDLHWVDVDVGGDVHRILLSDLPIPAGLSVRERMDWLAGPGDGLRELLIEPPFGDPAFCVDWITSADHAEAEAAFVIMECMGYPFFSGSNTMATACGLLASGRIASKPINNRQCLKLETPGGRVDAHVEWTDGAVNSVAIEGDEAFVHLADASVTVPGLGPLTYDLVWSGGHYVMIDAEALGLTPMAAALPDGLLLAGQIIDAVQADFDLHHPRLGDVGLPRFLHWMWPTHSESAGVWQAVGGTYGHPGVLWRCPTGTGTAARLALLAHAGKAGTGHRLENTSPAGTRFTGHVRGHGQVGKFPSIHTRVVGQPRVLSEVHLSLPATSPALTGRNLDWLYQ